MDKKEAEIAFRAYILYINKYENDMKAHEYPQFIKDLGKTLTSEERKIIFDEERIYKK
jgi:hypothetical protein